MTAQGLSQKQLDVLARLEASIPQQDVMPSGFTVTSTGSIDGQSPYLRMLQSFYTDLAKNAIAYKNFFVPKERGSGDYILQQSNRQPYLPKDVISPEGFPPWVKVVYAYPPVFGRQHLLRERTIKHVVLHSFGHGWHAKYITETGKSTGKYVGWMNSRSGGQGVISFQFQGETIYIPSGVDVSNMTHPRRMAAGLSALLRYDEGSSVHFVIDRAGNLLVIGGCQDLMYASNSLNDTSVAIELEEAFYVKEDPKKTPANWRPGSAPGGLPGTAGNVEYFKYSPEQLLTLSILCKKLEVYYPEIAQRNISLTLGERTKDSPGGYTTHINIRGSNHLDTSPQFMDQAYWNEFFALVDTHAGTINRANCMITGNLEWNDGKHRLVDPPPTGVVKTMTAQLLDKIRVSGIASARAAEFANAQRREINYSAGEGAVKQANTVAQQLSTTAQFIAQDSTLATDLPSTEQEQNTDAGSQVGADDWV